MEQLFANGRMIDVAIVVLLAEILLMLVWSRWRVALPALMPTLLSGLMLMLAWRATQAGLAWPWIAAPLLGSALAHGSDRWLGARRRAGGQVFSLASRVAPPGA